jgi:hypothetical protein
MPGSDGHKDALKDYRECVKYYLWEYTIKEK